VDKLTEALEKLCPGVTRRNGLRRVCAKCSQSWINCRCDGFYPVPAMTTEDTERKP
jgi:hypothetical protein